MPRRGIIFWIVAIVLSVIIYNLFEFGYKWAYGPKSTGWETDPVDCEIAIEGNDILAVKINLVEDIETKSNYNVYLREMSTYTEWYGYQEVPSSALQDKEETIRFSLQGIKLGVTAEKYNVIVTVEGKEVCDKFFDNPLPQSSVTPATVPTGSKVMSAGAWTTANHDFKRTGRSGYAGPEQPSLSWQAYGVTEPLYGGPFLGPDGTIYFSSYSLLAVDPDGRLKWEFKRMGGALTIGEDGTLYFGSEEAYNVFCFYAVSPQGTLKWKFDIIGDGDNFAPAIASDGTIYVATAFFSVKPDPSHLYALAPDGSLKWGKTINGQIRGSPALDDADNVYFGVYEDAGSKIYSIDPKGNVRWTYDYNVLDLAIAPNGSIYAACGTLIALNGDGNLKWECEGIGVINSDGLAVGSDGTAYLNTQDGKLYAVSPEGHVKWSLKYPGKYVKPPVTSPPSIDRNGVIYVGVCNYDDKGKVKDHYIYAVKSDGTLKWKFDPNNAVQYQIAIDNNGNLYTDDAQKIISSP